jgi:hypothetical protein
MSETQAKLGQDMGSPPHDQKIQSAPIDNHPRGIGWGPHRMRRGGWTGYGVY